MASCLNCVVERPSPPAEWSSSVGRPSGLRALTLLLAQARRRGAPVARPLPAPQPVGVWQECYGSFSPTLGGGGPSRRPGSGGGGQPLAPPGRRGSPHLVELLLVGVEAPLDPAVALGLAGPVDVLSALEGRHRSLEVLQELVSGIRLDRAYREGELCRHGAQLRSDGLHQEPRRVGVVAEAQERSLLGLFQK